MSEAIKLTLHLPWPPTANHIWQHARRMNYLSKEYKSFLELTFFSVRSQLPRKHKPLEDEVRVTILLFPPTNRKYDVDNRVKPILDALTKAGVWEDDSQVRTLTVSKCFRRDDEEPEAIVTIEGF